MCSGSRLWCRALVGALLVSLGATLDIYDQPHAYEDLLYQDGNDLDTGPVAESRPMPHYSDVILRTIFQALKVHGSGDQIPYRNYQLPREGYERRLKARVPDEADVKGSVYKRLAEVYGGSHHSGKNDAIRPQQKWKIKKGKAIGSQMVCYFKLCAFRSPT